jgi:SAM-dependent methyltransferase
MTEPELARGYIEHIRYLNGIFFITGWMLLPNHPFDDICIKINNISYGKVKPHERKDVQSVFPFMSTALNSGFEFSFPIPEDILRDWVDIDILGTHNGSEIAILSTIYRLDFNSFLPEPPPRLMRRVANTEDPIFYWCGAAKSYGEFIKPIRKYCDIGAIRHLLDWGCGCGRVTSLFLKYSTICEIYGCDIDEEAVNWCTANLQQGHFSVINPYPPTHYGDRMFDVIIGHSVFTHLMRDVQISWLKEVKRILIPEGFFLASVHGDFASLFSGPSIVKEVLENGISDSHMDSILDGIAPTGYYRAVLQSKAYTLREFGKHFKIIDYIERGMDNFQDFVVMQKIK